MLDRQGANLPELSYMESDPISHYRLSKTYTASTDPNNPTLVRLDGINLPAGGKVIKIVSPVAAAGAAVPTYIKIYVQGDINTAGASYINLDPSVNAIIYLGGNLNLQGAGIINNSFLARQLVINGLRPAANADGTLPDRSINIATTSDFEGVVYAPNHDLNLALQAVPGSTGGSGSGQIASLILNLNQQIAAAQQNIAALTLDYNNNMFLYNLAPGNSGHSFLERAQQDQTNITNLTTQVTNLTAQLTTLMGINPASSADDHLRGYNGIYGGFVANTITVASKTHVHYDATLRTAGTVNHYEIVNWFEDNISHGAVGGASAYWWAGTNP